jgi:hypothetical protein
MLQGVIFGTPVVLYIFQIKGEEMRACVAVRHVEKSVV